MVGRQEARMTANDRHAASTEISVLEGDEAFTWLKSKSAGSALEALYRRCPWATRFQSSEFVSIWYRCYADIHDPIILFHQNDEHLDGFFPLARCKRSGRLMVAGDHQAEYQGWLALPDDDSFILAALQTIKQRYRPDVFRLRYLPAKTPLGWMDRPLASGAIVERRPHSRPLFNLADSDKISESLRKKSNKSRFNRLKRLGKVELRHLETRDELEAVIDRIIIGYDLRQGAANGISPFALDKKKRQFHLDLMAHPGLMQASVLTVGEEVAAAHLGIVSGDSVSVGIYAYSPILAKHSPGKFLMLMLGVELAAKGMSWIDLTPGGTWKDRFATEHDDVLEATIVFDRSLARRRQATEICLGAAKSSLALIGVRREQVRDLRRNLHPKLLFDRTRAALGGTEERLTLHLPCSEASLSKPAQPAFAKDRIEDLLLAAPEDWPLDLKAFLAASVDRLGDGQHVYTRVENGRLVQTGWTGKDPNAQDLPDRTTWLLDLTTSTSAEGQDLDRHCLETILADVANQSDRLATTLPAHDGCARRRFEALGFRAWKG